MENTKIKNYTSLNSIEIALYPSQSQQQFDVFVHIFSHESLEWESINKI